LRWAILIVFPGLPAVAASHDFDQWRTAMSARRPLRVVTCGSDGGVDLPTTSRMVHAGKRADLIAVATGCIDKLAVGFLPAV
jgi:hypothetical protein